MANDTSAQLQTAIRTVQARMAAVMATLRLWEGQVRTPDVARRCAQAQDHIQAQLGAIRTGVPVAQVVTMAECALRMVRGIANDLSATGVLNESVSYRSRLLMTGLTKSLRELQYWQDRVNAEQDNK